ncbi:MAG: YbaK/EbsC family protein [Pseudomonadota bacterium]
MSKSVKRVAQAAADLGLEIDIKRMGQSTRTAEDAAIGCGCDVAQIVKSLIFQGRGTGDLILLLVSGANRVDLAKAAAAVGQPLDRADADVVRARTGFAIGGVAPIGHLTAPAIWMDRTLINYAEVWAAAGAPDAVFQVAPGTLQKVTGAALADLSEETRASAKDTGFQGKAQTPHP